MNDPILNIALTPRVQSEAQRALPWGDDAARHARQCLVVVCAACACLAAVLLMLGGAA